MNDRIDSDAALEAEIAQAYREYVAASREQQRPAWQAVEGLTGQRREVQDGRAKARNSKYYRDSLDSAK